MLLTVPNSWGWVYDNYTTTEAPSAFAGVTVTASGSTNTKGSWTRISAGPGALTTIANECHMLEIGVNTGAGAAAAKQVVLDIGADPAAGTTYGTISVLRNLVCGMSEGWTGRPNIWTFPLRIPAGCTVGARIASSVASTTASVTARYYGLPAKPEASWVGQISETVGSSNADAVPTGSKGTTVVPGDSGAWNTTIGTAAGNWHSLGTTTNRLRWLQLCGQADNTALAELYYYFEIGYGDGAAVVTASQRIWVRTSTGERFIISPHFMWTTVPAGATIYVRACCSGTSDTGINVCVVGVG